MNDLNEAMYTKLYKQFQDGIVKKYLKNKHLIKVPYIVENNALKS